MFVGHDEAIVRIGFRGSTSGSRNGTFHWAGSLVEVARLRGQVVHTPAIRRSCLLPAGKDQIFYNVMHGYNIVMHGQVRVSCFFEHLFQYLRTTMYRGVFENKKQRISGLSSIYMVEQRSAPPARRFIGLKMYSSGQSGHKLQCAKKQEHQS